jgi:hypothetical protein
LERNLPVNLRINLERSVGERQPALGVTLTGFNWFRIATGLTQKRCGTSRINPWRSLVPQSSLFFPQQSYRLLLRTGVKQANIIAPLWSAAT